MKGFVIASALTLVGSCATTRYSTKIENIKNNIQLTDSATVMRFANTITANELKTHLIAYASNDFQGRKTGELGQKKAANFLKEYYQSQNIYSPIKDSLYYQEISKAFLPDNIKSTENVLAYIKGSEKPDEVVIISAHLDHLGIEDDQIFNGADDNGSGTTALMEMAQAFQLAALEGFMPKRSILFLHLTGEELGLYGSRYYIENPIFDLNKTMVDLNIDMIGRIDKKHEDNPNYLYVIGADRISKELHFISEKINDTYFHLDLDYTYNDEDDHNRYYYRSDHYKFAQENIPVIFYFNGEHDDYHQATDTPDKIEYDLLATRARLIFSTAWYLANKEHKLIHNEDI
ncbi:M28 family peptidase [Bizionia hallyeonensis]|uniref:M28 family peptidase n=1 Tax=Bizionia hallyeonensis TaxID=1123757 RepID=A0ABW0C403_9FLAO|nr:M28 family peptidase [Bizionia sp. M204]UPS91333.1 M28 family peptidase [Bizionia sp. M204]